MSVLSRFVIERLQQDDYEGIYGIFGAAEAATVSDRFMDAMGSHDYRGASGLFTPEMQAKASPASLKGMEALMESRDGGYVSHGTPQWYVQNYNGQTSVRLTYPVHYAKGFGNVTVVMVRTDGSYRVYGGNFNP